MTRTLISALAGLFAVLLGLEAVLRLLPVSSATMTGYHHDADVLNYPPHHRWQVSTGWDLRNPQPMVSNNWGFVSRHDFVPDPRAVALIGDSFVEASMLDRAHRPDAQLEILLGDKRRVYAMGSPGTALLDHAQRIRIASVEFQVEDFVLVLERFDARQSLCGSGNVHSRCLDPTSLQPRIERHAPPGTLKRVARHSALAQYLAGQLRLQPTELLRAMFTRSTPEEAARASGPPMVAPPPDATKVQRARRVVDAVVDAFFAEASPYLRGRLVVVVDGRRDGPPTVPELIDIERAYLIERLRAGGATVHDLEPRFANHKRQSARSLQVGPYDGHLNALGVALAMTAAAESLDR